MMKCKAIINGTECGSDLSETANFCPECGGRTADAVILHCPCGVTLRGSHKFCHNCGQPVQLPDSSPQKCLGKHPDGSICGYALLPFLNFCPNCGTKKSTDINQTVSLESETDLQQTSEEDCPKQGESDVDPPVSKAVSASLDESQECDEKNTAPTEILKCSSGGNGKPPASSGNEKVLQKTPLEDSSKEGEGDVEPVGSIAGSSPHSENLECENNAVETETSECTSEGSDPPGQFFSQYADMSWTKKEISTVLKTISNEGKAHEEENNSDSDADDGQRVMLLKTIISGNASGHTQSTDLASVSENQTVQEEVMVAEEEKNDELQKEKDSYTDNDSGLKDNVGHPASNNSRLKEKTPCTCSDDTPTAATSATENLDGVTAAMDEESSGAGVQNSEKFFECQTGSSEEDKKDNTEQQEDETNNEITTHEEVSVENREDDETKSFKEQGKDGAEPRGDKTKDEKTDQEKESQSKKTKCQKKENENKKAQLSEPEGDPLGVQGKKPESPQKQPNTYANAVKEGKGEQKEKIQTRASTAKRNSSQALKSGDERVTVVFHVIISALFKVDVDTDAVCIRCEPKTFGGFSPEADRNLLKFMKDTDIGPLYEGKIAMHRSIRNGGFVYKYLVRRSGKDKVEWEYVMKKSTFETVGHQHHPKIVNRKFSVPEKERSFAGDWHKYDGVAYPDSIKDSTLTSAFKSAGRFFMGKVFQSHQERVREEAVFSAKMFLPSPEDIVQVLLNPVGASKSKLTAEDLLAKVNCVISSLRPQMLDIKLQYVDEALVQRSLRDNLVEPLIMILEETVQKDPSKRTATLCLFVTVLKLEHFVFIKPKWMNLLCRSMLLHPDLENRTCPDLNDISTHFPLRMNDKNSLARDVTHLIDKSDVDQLWNEDPSWWCCIPLLHFVSGSSTPFQDPDPSVNFKSNSWWGITDFINRKDRFKTSVMLSQGKMIMDCVELLEPCFAADALLARSIVASLDIRPLLPVLLKAPVPLEVMAATLIHHLKSRGYFLETERQDLVNVMKKMIHIMNQQERGEMLEKAETQLKKLRCQANLTDELLSTVLKSLRLFDEKFMFDAIYLVFLALDQWAYFEESACKKNDTPISQEWQRDANNVIKTVCDTVSHTHQLRLSRYDKHKLPKHLKVWGQLFMRTEGLTNEPLKQHLEKLITENFESEVNGLPADDKLDVYLNQMEQVVPAFVGILNRLAFESLEEAFKEGSSHLGMDNVHLISLLSTLLERKWNEASSGGKDIFTFILTWVPMVNYLQRFNDQKSMKSMGENAKQIIRYAVDSVTSHQELLVSGSIPVCTLQFILHHCDRFCSVVTAAGFDRTKTENVLALRRHELDSYMQIAYQLDKLFEYCHDFFKTGDFEDIRIIIEQQRENTGQCLLLEVVEVSPSDDAKNLNEYKPNSNPWKFPEEVLAILPDFQEKITSVIFEKMLLKSARKMLLDTVSFWRAFLILWQDVTQEWQALCEKMVDGSITLANTEKVFSMFKSGNEAYNFTEMDEDLKKMRKCAGGGSEDWVDQRIKQFHCYMTIKNHVAAAGALLRIRKAFKIEGNFTDIEKICNLNRNTSLPIRDLDESVLGLCDQLNGISQQDIKCLAVLQKQRCVDFFEWLKENMKDGLKELNVFVDLAFISAGEEAYAIGRVNCFHAAATGYAPLIFTEMVKGCGSLLTQCKLVFANARANPKLPDMLDSTIQYLDWFKDVQKSHGSVERTSMSQVGNINARGVFRLGRGARRGMDQIDQDLSSIIQLSVSEDNEGKVPARRYNYEELLDLQSRLMLVAGQAEKGKENVDRFITVMESLVRLGKTYVQLCKDGCVLFLDWGVEFLCDVERPVCCVSEFSKQGKLKGHRTLGGHSTGKAEEMEDFIAGVAGFLEHCHREWLVYVDQKRKDYPELNAYTVEQLVFLQQQLVKVGFGDVSNLVFPMLSLLKADCSPKDLEEALQEAMDYVDSLQEGQQNIGPLHQPQHSQQQKKDVKNKDTLVRDLIDEGFPKHLAQRASKEDDVNSLEEGLRWCMDHVDDMDQFSDDSHTDSEEETQMNEEERSEQVVGQRLREWLTRTETITQSVIGWLDNMDRKKEGTTLEALICNLGSVWRKFLETVSASGTDFLSFEHLGIVLRCLAAKDKRQFNRSLPPDFKQKVPNLVICPKSEVLNIVTYMYMFPQDENSLLPQPDEVLLCTENTTFEQVDIFLRRAYFGIQQKVYCLAFADSLDYDVGEKSEKKIKEYTMLSDDRNFNLVVVCASENEYRARIVAALEKHRCPSPSLSDTNLVRNYLGLRFAHNMAGGRSASASDPEGLCVRVVKSHRSGVGKTLYKQRLTAKLKARFPQERRPLSITIPLHSRVADIHNIAACLLHSTLDPADTLPRIVHLDISYQVQEGVDHLLYNLLVLGCVTDSHGKVWLRSPLDHYLVETMPLQDQKDPQRGRVLVHQILNVLPSLSCWSPRDSLNILKTPKSMPGYQQHDQLFDDQEFRSEMYQRPFRYLHDLDTKGQQQQGPNDLIDNKVHCLTILLKYCGVTNPSWSELTHFVHFLNKQLMDFENSVYCSMAASADLPGFSVFVLRFLIQMSRDFATRSLNMSEESLSALERDADENDIQQYEMRRTWESSPHPYIFFNPDEHSMTFLGFSIESASGNLVDQQTGQVLEKGIMSRQLYQALVLNQVPLTESFDTLPRQDRLLRLYRVLGLHDEEIFDNNQIIDPDPTYELTTDNVKKILAIYMRFRCNIPVIVMGETGCGKTRLVKFLCSLQTPRQNNISTMVLVKVHGGTTGEDIIKKVEDAEKVAQRNAAEIQHRPVYTVLFFDEANTTEAVGVIKEVMCDGTLSGQLSNLSLSLKMVAACNPYRKHSDDLIKRLENAGLGYHVDAEKTVDKLGKVPMRRLVYRVQPLPQSMLPLVWDFGQLNRQVEELYIRQMVKRYVQNDQLGDLDEAGVNVLCKILMESQEFMRKLADECSFVSLRDVERALTMMSWFLEQAWESGVMFQLLETKLLPEQEESEDEEEEEEEEESLNSDVTAETESDMSDITKALVLSLGACYRACLRSKETYDRHIINFFQPPFTLPDGVEQFALIIDRCQEVFLDNVRLEENIAPNQALKENVFMMVVCVELRIPLFLVGKPGSSKSLAKTIVADAMQGNSAYFELFKTFKQAQMVSFQCSPLATADGILGTFRQCAQFQRDKNKDRFVSVVVLDEVGLAEDSPKMPLKTLHPLLEDGCPGDEVPDDSKKVAFIGISNWALDPAKMNRGILVQRDIPDQEELIETARGICTTQDERTLQNMKTLIPYLAQAYLEIFDEAKLKREFFGLRDFYSLVKMVYAFAARSKRKPSPCELTAAIRRNFGGLDSVDPVEFFKKQLPHKLNDEKARPGDPDCSASGLIKAALSGDDMGGESRYLLLLTENYGGLSILSENLLADRRVVPIFGSSFPKDQEYTQICRNINRIKVCMEVGQTVILLNLENLYESLYDALNQYYAMLGGERYVDLGLGTHRVKCRVHRQFRLMVVAEKQVVYDKFPIPLINRLEKHFLTLNNIMTDAQLNMARRLEKWAKEFVNAAPFGIISRFLARNRKEETVGDVFMGFHPDTAPAIVLKVWSKLQVDGRPPSEEQVLGECQRMLLWCATPDAVVRSQSKEWNEVYLQEQQHDHLQQYLYQQFQQHTPMIMAQVTTHSKLLSERERMELCNSLPVTSITLLSLQAFDTEQQFCQQLRLFFGDREQGMKLLVVQCDCGDINQNLIKCAQYCMQDLWPADSTQHHVVFIIQLPRVAGACFTGFLGGNWHCLHIDDLRKTERPVPSMHLLQSHSPAELIMASEPTAHHSQHNVYVHTDSHIQQNMVAGDNRKEAALGGTPEQMEVDELDVEDVHIQMEAAVNTAACAAAQAPSQPDGFDPEYVRHLFTTSIQAAVALVRDAEDNNAHRATHRITMLLRLIDENPEFFRGLHKLVGTILMEKEQKALKAERWLSEEAAKLDSVKKAGTFRRAWMQYVENKVVPVLAGAVAYLDTNYNLDILYTCHTQQPPAPAAPQWVARLWLAILQGGVCRLSYKQLLSVSGKDDLDEFTVTHTGAGALSFSARLPFSWMLWEVVDTAICGAKNMEGDLLNTAGSVVEQSLLGKCIQIELSGSKENLQHMFHLYISDLLHLTFPLMGAQHELLCGCVEKGLEQLHINLVQMEVGQGLVALHVLVDKMRSRLQSVLDMAGVRPRAVEALKARPDGPCADLLNTPDEMTEDIVLLRLLVEELQPRPSQFRSEEGCIEWTRRYTTFAPVVLRILSDSDPALQLKEKVEEEEEEEEEVEELDDIEGRRVILPYGDRCKQQLTSIRCIWTRLTAVKLFFDFVGPLRQGPEKLSKALEDVKFQLLWNLLDEDADMKSVKTLKLLDKFIKTANGCMIKGLLGRIGSCSFCKKKLEATPVELPCKHILCNSCYRDCIHGKRNETKCPECEAQVPRNFDPATAGCQDREAAELLGRYQRQVSGFLMAVVSQLCFAGKEPPEPEAVRHIFSYIIHTSHGRTLLQTKQMTVHDDLIDPTPVLRSFLLRLLLKHSEKEVHGYLNEFLENTQKLAEQQSKLAVSTKSSSAPTLLEFCLLIIHCREELHYEQASLNSTDTLQSEDQLVFLANKLYNTRRQLMGQRHLEVLTVLYLLGFMRYALDTCARILHDTFTMAGTGEPLRLSEPREDLLAVLQLVCTDHATDWPKKFLIKQLCREYGIENYMALTKMAPEHPVLQWMILESGNKVEEVADRYLVCPDPYKDIRDEFAQLKVTGNVQAMMQILQRTPLSNEIKEVLLLLAIHREVATTVMLKIPEDVRTKMVDAIRDFVEKCDVIQYKALAHQLCSNEPGSVHCIQPTQDLGEQSLICLLTHLQLVLRQGVYKSNLLHPLSTLAFQPAMMAKSLLPTMPQDNLEEILKGMGKSSHGVFPTVWSCPKGHRYLVGDCGKPVPVDARCNICGAKIGGKKYDMIQDNNVEHKDVKKADQTKTGHILGVAAQRGLESLPERDLSAVECALLRFLTHAALYMGASNPAQRDAVVQMVNPRIAPDEVCKFFWDHLRHDLQVLQKVLGRSADDVYLILHNLCQEFTTKKQKATPVLLITKEERADWEKDFATRFAQPCIQTIDAVLTKGNMVVASDKRQGGGTLLSLVYEMDETAPTQGDADISNLQNTCAVWRYRPRVTVEHFFRHFNLEVESRHKMKGKFQVLRLFRMEQHIVHALHYVPSILAGQKRLMMQLHCRLDRAEAATLTVAKVMSRKDCAGLNELLKNFSKAWEMVKEHLITYSCKTPMEGLVSVPEEFHNCNITKESPVAVLLPSTHGPGLCAYVLLQFLLSRHNDFLERYCPMVNQLYKQMPEVSVRNITQRHLVGCSPERDILPMVLAHCNYSLMVGEAATHDYDFTAFEQQLTDSVLQCKARVQRAQAGYIPVETMVYRADTTSSRLFKILREKIAQECLSPAERRQIVEDLRDNLPDICLSIDNLNTALSFLKALGGDPLLSVHEFMSSALRMKRTICSRKAQQLCSLTHVQSLWVVLCYQRATILAAHHQDAFDSVEKELREELSPEQVEEMEAVCQHMSIERLELLLLQLFELIMLRLSEPRDQDDDTQPEHISLRDMLGQHLESPLYSKEPVELSSRLPNVDDIAFFPESVKCRHATATWILCRSQLSSKLQM